MSANNFDLKRIIKSFLKQVDDIDIIQNERFKYEYNGHHFASINLAQQLINLFKPLQGINNISLLANDKKDAIKIGLNNLAKKIRVAENINRNFLIARENWSPEKVNTEISRQAVERASKYSPFESYNAFVSREVNNTNHHLFIFRGFFPENPGVYKSMLINDCTDDCINFPKYLKLIDDVYCGLFGKTRFVKQVRPMSLSFSAETKGFEPELDDFDDIVDEPCSQGLKF